MLRTPITLLTLLGLACLLPLTGCATQSSSHRRAIEPTWTYHDTPDPLAYSDVWQRPIGPVETQVAHVPGRFDGFGR